MPKSFRKVLVDFSGGLIDAVSPRDLTDSQFQEFKNITNRVMGQIASENVHYVASGDNTDLIPSNLGLGRGFLNVRLQQTINNTPVDTPSVYWFIIAPDDDGKWDVHYHSKDVGVGGTWLKLSTLDGALGLNSLGWTNKIATGVAITASNVNITHDSTTDDFTGLICHNISGIPYGATIASRTNNTTHVLSQAPTVSASGLTLKLSLNALPDTYFTKGAVRLSDGTLVGTSVWYGLVKQAMFGYGDSLTPITPNYSQSKINYNEFIQTEHHLAPPTLIKMDACHDLNGQVKNSGEVGIYVHEPMQHRGVRGGQYEEISFPLTINESTGSFNALDRYACTFEYDGVQESELSRNSDGTIGVSGFEVAEVDDRDIEIITYLNSTGEEIDSEVMAIIDAETPEYQQGNYGQMGMQLKALDATYGTDVVVTAGDYIKISSEIMLITRVEGDFDTNRTTVWVHRGVNDTKPLHSDELIGEKVYRYPTQQRARAINLVLNKGITTAPSIFVNSQAFFDSDGVSDFFLIRGNAALGTNALNITVELESNGGGASPAQITVTKEIVHGTSFNGFGNTELTIRLAVQNATSGSTYNIKKSDIAALINNGTNVSGYIDGVSSNVQVINTFKINLADYFTCTFTGNDREVDNSQTLTMALTGGDDTPKLNARITAINLYWQPKGEPDWFLVDRYGINKGYSDSQFSSRDFYPQVWQRKDMANKASHIRNSFGHWIECPYWHFNSHNSSGDIKIPFLASTGAGPRDVYMGIMIAQTSSGGVTHNPWKDRARVGDIALLAPIDDAMVTSDVVPDISFYKAIGKFNQLRTNYLPIQSITTWGMGGGVGERLHSIAWGHSTGSAQDGVLGDTDTMERMWDSANNLLYLSLNSEQLNRFGFVNGSYIVLQNRSGAHNGVDSTGFHLSEGSPTFNYAHSTTYDIKESPFGIFRIQTVPVNMTSLLTVAQKAFFADLLTDDDSYFDFDGNNGDGTTTLMDVPDGFIQGVGATFVKDGTKGKFKNSGGAKGRIYLPFTTVVGQSYNIQFSVLGSTTDDTDVRASLSTTTSWNDTNETSYLDDSEGNAMNSVFIATGVLSYLHFENESAVINEECHIYDLQITNTMILMDSTNPPGTTPIPKNWTSDDTFFAMLKPGHDMVNHFGGSMYDNVRAVVTDSSLGEMADNRNIGMEVMVNQPGVRYGVATDGVPGPYLCGYEMISTFGRRDAVSTFYRPFIGERLFTYQSLTGRTGATRIKPVKWAASEIAGTIAVIGNVDTVDDDIQTVREASRIMWTLPNRYDDFCILRSKEINSIDGAVIRHLAAMGNILYVMKDTNTYALDMAQNFKEVRQFIGYGVPFDSKAFTKSPIGLIIANNNGIFILPDMTELSRPIRDQWQAKSSPTPTLAYHPERNQIIATLTSLQALSANDFIYDIEKKSWTNNDLFLAPGGGDIVATTNFINSDRIIEVGRFVNTSHNIEQVVKFYSTNKQSSGSFKTKDFFFGAPGRLKTVQDIIITYKGRTSIEFLIDGETTEYYKRITLPTHLRTATRRAKVNVECKSLTLRFEFTSGSTFLIEDIILEGYVSDKF